MQDNILEACKLGVILHAAESLFHSILHGLLLHELLLYIIYCSVMLCRLPPGILDVWVGPRIKQKLVHILVSLLCSTVERGGVTVIPILVLDDGVWIWMPIQIEKCSAYNGIRKSFPIQLWLYLHLDCVENGLGNWLWSQTFLFIDFPAPLGSAPFSRRSSTTSIWPSMAAQWSGVNLRSSRGTFHRKFCSLTLHKVE